MIAIVAGLPGKGFWQAVLLKAGLISYLSCLGELIIACFLPKTKKSPKLLGLQARRIAAAELGRRPPIVISTLFLDLRFSFFLCRCRAVSRSVVWRCRRCWHRCVFGLK
ncbi:hypothetical protein OAE54_00335 [bacterium]|nr:hypothetical protein [bacterium]